MEFSFFKTRVNINAIKMHTKAIKKNVITISIELLNFWAMIELITVSTKIIPRNNAKTEIIAVNIL